MAILHSIASGNFTSSSTWALVDPISFWDNRTTNTLISTTPAGTPTFIPGAIIVQGISIQIAYRQNSATGTFTVQLYNSTTSTIVASVTINAIDLPAGTNSTSQISWTYFKFGSSVTLVAGNSYSVRLVSSVNSQVAVFRDPTGNNWSRALVTTTTIAPLSGDTTIISGQYTSTGVNSVYTITMNSTSNTTAYGTLYSCSNGVLNYGTASSTNYALKLAGNLYIGYGGTLTIGTSLSPIPGSSTASLEISCTSALQYSVLSYGTFTTYGSSRTMTKTKLAADVSIGATSSSTTDSTGWLSGDVIVVPSTTRTYTEVETITLSSNATGTTLTHIGTPYVNAHGGNSTTKVQADICNITRNINIFSTSATNRTNIQLFQSSVSSLYWTKFYDIGNASTTSTSGIGITSLTTGILDFQYNVITYSTIGATTNIGACMASTTDTNQTISNNIFYALGYTTSSTILFALNGITNNNFMIGCMCSAASSGSFALMGSGNIITSNQGTITTGFYSNSTNNYFYSNGSYGFILNSNTSTNNTNLTNFYVWRNNSYGIALQLFGGSYNKTNILNFSNFYVFGNTTGAFTFTNGLNSKIYFSNSYIYGGSTFVQPVALSNSSNLLDSLYFDTCYFGYSDAGITTSPHTTAIISGLHYSNNVFFSNCYFNGTEATYINGMPIANMQTGYVSLNHNGVTASNKQWQCNGNLQTDNIIINNSPVSLRLIPNNNTYKLTSNTTKIAVRAGNTCTVSVTIRKSVVTDGTVYNGSQPRLMYAFNPISGNMIETIGATSSAVGGVWETLTYTTPTITNDSVLEFYVDCDGTTGWINISNWSTTTFVDTRNTNLWSTATSYIEADWRRPGGTYTFVS